MLHHQFSVRCTKSGKKAQREKRVQSRARKIYHSQLARWSAGPGLPVTPPHILKSAENLVYIRWNPYSRKVETSKGIRIPADTALILWQQICRIRSGKYKNTPSTILGVQVGEVSAKWLKVGCHHIPMAQAEKIAPILRRP